MTKDKPMRKSPETAKFALLSVALLSGCLLGSPAQAQMGGMGGGMGGGGGRGGAPSTGSIDPGGDQEAPRAPDGPHIMKPIPLKKFDAAVTNMFAQADANHDGRVTLAEFNAVIAARREKVIAARFHDIDTNHNGQIDYNEFLAWQMQLGSLAQSDRGAGPYGEVVPASITPDLGDGERDEALMTAIEPLNAVTIAKADKNYDGAVTLDELLAYENARFEKADIDKDGYLSQDEIMQMRGGHHGMGGGMGGPGMGPR